MFQLPVASGTVPDGDIVSILTDFCLECTDDNGSSTDVWESVSSTEQQFPALTGLFVDGRNYYNACKGDPGFTAKCTELGYLAISHYKPLPGESFLASDFLRPITMIKDLQTLYVITLDPSPVPFPASIERPFLTKLHLQDIPKSQSWAEIFDILTNASAISFTHSATGDVGPFNSEGCLALEDIDDDQDLVPLLRAWEGHYLAVKHRPGFDNTVLRMMAPREDGIRNCASNMAELTILACPNFSVAALKQLVSAKLNAADGHALRKLRIYNDAPVISDEDLEWLRENLDEFYMPQMI